MSLMAGCKTRLSLLVMGNPGEQTLRQLFLTSLVSIILFLELVY